MGALFKIFYFVVKKRNDRLGTVVKILHFSVKNEWPFGYTHLKNIISFTISCHSEQFLEKRKSIFSGKYTETYLGRFQTFTMEQDGTF